MLSKHQLTDCGPQYIKTCYNNTSNIFCKDTLNSWLKIIESDQMKNKYNKLHTPIWYNNNIKINNTHIFYKEWYIKGVRYIKDLINDNKQFYKYCEFVNKYNIQTNFLTYQGLINAIKDYTVLNDIDFTQDCFYPMLPLNNKGAKDMYNILNIDKDIKPY